MKAYLILVQRSSNSEAVGDILYAVGAENESAALHILESAIPKGWRPIRVFVALDELGTALHLKLGELHPLS